MSDITKEQLLAVLTNSDARKNVDAWIDPLNGAMAEWKIDTPVRQAAFLAQVLHESGELQHLVENLNYSADRLRQVWPSRFPSDEVAALYGTRAEKIANKVYASRMGNGDEASGDGWKFRGRGLIQLTGRENYAKCAKALEVDLLATPEVLAEPVGAAHSAAWYWALLNLNALADDDPKTGAEGATERFIRITRLINGGTTGLQSRLNYWRALQRELA